MKNTIDWKAPPTRPFRKLMNHGKALLFHARRLVARTQVFLVTQPRTMQLKAVGGAWGVLVLLNALLLPHRYAPEVKIERIALRPFPLIVRAAGNLEARESFTARAQFDGPVVEKFFREGQKVQKGQKLLVMGRDRIRLERQQKKDALLNSEADLGKARKDLRLQKMLYRKQAVPRSSVDDARTALIKAEQAWRSAQESMRLNGQIWESAEVTAPFSGTVVKDWFGDDKFVMSGKELVTVADISEFTVKARVDELEIKQIHEGQRAQIKIQIFADQPFEAVVRDVGSQPEGSGIPEVPVTLLITDTHGLLLRPKLTAEARILTGMTEPVLSVSLDGGQQLRWNAAGVGDECLEHHSLADRHARPDQSRPRGGHLRAFRPRAYLHRSGADVCQRDESGCS